MTTMPPAVQNLSPATKSPVSPKPEASGAATGADFREELSRQRRADRPKSPRPANTKKKPEPPTETAPADDAQPADETKPADEPTPVAEAAEQVVDEAPAPDAEPPPTAENEPTAAPLAAATAGSAAVVNVKAPTDIAEDDAPAPVESAADAPVTVTVSEVITGGAGQDEIPTKTDEPAKAGPAASTADDGAEPVEEDPVAIQTARPRVERHATEDGASEEDPDPDKNEPTADTPPDAQGTSPGARSARVVSANVSTLPAIDPAAHQVTTTPPHPPASPVVAHAEPTPPDLRFATDNHENIVRNIRTNLLPNGGSMRIRLDPPQLGALQVTVQIRDGVVTAAFETTSDEATRLLGHSLNQLKSVLESHGVTVDKLQVQQAPKTESQQAPRDGQHDRGQSNSDQEHAARQEQQRRELLRRMWRRLAGGVPDPLDVTG